MKIMSEEEIRLKYYRAPPQAYERFPRLRDCRWENLNAVQGLERFEMVRMFCPHCAIEAMSFEDDECQKEFETHSVELKYSHSCPFTDGMNVAEAHFFVGQCYDCGIVYWTMSLPNITHGE